MNPGSEIHLNDCDIGALTRIYPSTLSHYDPKEFKEVCITWSEYAKIYILVTHSPNIILLSISYGNVYLTAQDRY